MHKCRWTDGHGVVFHPLSPWEEMPSGNHRVVCKIQPISDIRPAFLDNQNGPYKQYGPISGNTLEEGPGEEVKGLISMEM